MPGGDFLQQLMQNSPDARYKEIGNKRWVSNPDWDHYYESCDRLNTDNDIGMLLF